jgi:hypothetical protein
MGSKRKIKCQFCSREFKTFNALNAHLRFCPERPRNIRAKEEAEERERRYREDHPFQWG